MEGWVGRLKDGERNHWLVYELCKQWQPDNLAAIKVRLAGADGDVVIEGWEEYKASPWFCGREGLGESG